MYNLIEYSNNYSKRSGSLRQFHSDESTAAIANFESFISKIRIKEITSAAGNTKDVELQYH